MTEHSTLSQFLFQSQSLEITGKGTHYSNYVPASRLEVDMPFMAVIQIEFSFSLSLSLSFPPYFVPPSLPLQQV